MITYKRPLKASDIYDVSISAMPKQRQNVFWSIGYKSSEMRKIYKPLKNMKPIQINFGRRPKWNCPVDGQDAEEEENAPLDFQLSMSESQNVRLNKSPGRSRVKDSSFKKLKVIKTTPAPKSVTLPARRKIPRTKVGPNSSINNWSDIFSPPTATQPERGGFKPELTNKYVRKSQQVNTERNKETFSDRFNSPRRVYSLPDHFADAEQAGSVNLNNMKPLKNKNQLSSSLWDVPSVSCSNSKTKKKPIYVQLGPSAVHRGNQGRLDLLKLK